jgi:hypothetical protein
VTYAGQAERGFSRLPTYTISRVAAVIAALVAAGIIALVAFQVLGLQRPLNVAPPAHPLVLAAEGRWELQHQLASGDLDLQRQAEREWESQRRQVSLALS